MEELTHAQKATQNHMGLKLQHYSQSKAQSPWGACVP